MNLHISTPNLWCWVATAQDRTLCLGMNTHAFKLSSSGPKLQYKSKWLDFFRNTGQLQLALISSGAAGVQYLCKSGHLFQGLTWGTWVRIAWPRFFSKKLLGLEISCDQSGLRVPVLPAFRRARKKTRTAFLMLFCATLASWHWVACKSRERWMWAGEGGAGSLSGVSQTLEFGFEHPFLIQTILPVPRCHQKVVDKYCSHWVDLPLGWQWHPASFLLDSAALVSANKPLPAQ